MGWKSPVSATDYDLVDGEANYDDWQKAVMARMAGVWYCLHQPERVLVNPSSIPNWEPGRQKNFVYSSSGNESLNLPLSFDEVALGTVVRVFNFKVSGGTLTVTFGGSGGVTVTLGTMCEYVFFSDSGTARWLATQQNVSAAKRG